MRTAIGTILLAPILLSLSSAARCEPPRLPDLGETVEIDDELRVEAIALGAYLIVHREPWAANSLLVVMPDGTLVLCDTPWDDVATGRLLTWLRSAFGERPMVAINSHYHADAMGGNGALQEAGVPTYGADLSARMLDERGAALRRQLLEHLPDDAALRERFERARWQPPARRFDAAEGLELRFGGERVVLHHPGPAHSPDNIVTWFPDRHLLFGGCMVRAAERLPNVADADLDGWPRAVENLRRFDAAIVVPGHGRAGGPELLDVTLRAIERHRGAAEARTGGSPPPR